MNSPVKMMRQLRKRVQSVTYGSAIYKMMLDQGPVPERIRLSIVDPWPGDARQGQALIASQPGLFDAESSPLSSRPRCFLSHEWLRDLRAVGSDLAKRKAATLIKDWIEEQETWDDQMWAPDVLGARLANWISFYDFYGSALSRDLSQKHKVAMVRQLRHLIHTAPADLTGIEGLNVIKGLVFGGLGLLDGEKAMGLALDFLKRQLAQEILPDGGVVSRNPLRQADMLRALIDIRAALRAAQLDIPHELSLAITRMVPALKFFRHGDGGLALFHGGREEQSLILDAALTLSETKGRLLKRLPQTNYERLTAGRSLLLMDVGAPPPRPYDREAHVGLLSFEFSVGRERLIVNCGAGPEDDEEWHRALGATAAHSTVTLGDTNACELLLDGGIGQRPRTVVSQRYEQDGVQYVEASHDGYENRQKTVIQRLLSLAASGEEVQGRETIAGPLGQDFTVRWHLHPSVNALIAQGGGAVLLRTASGQGWRLRVQDAGALDLALESSVYCADGAPRRTLQIRVMGRMRNNPTVISWSLRRETTKKGSGT